MLTNKKIEQKQITIDDLKKIEEYKKIGDEEALVLVDSIKEFCRFVVESVVNEETVKKPFNHEK